MGKLIWLMLFALSLFGGDYVVVAGAKSPITELSAKGIKDIFLKKRRFAGDVAVVPINLSPTDPIRIGMDRDSLNEHWVISHYQGVKPPIVQRSERGVQAFVQNRPEALGYLRKELVESGMKVLHEF